MKGFDLLFYLSPQPMWVFDVNTLHIIEVNEAAIKRYGFTQQEFLSKTILDLRIPEDVPLVVKVLPDIRGTKTRYREFKHVAKNGRILNVEIMSYPLIFKSVKARLVIAQNIDEKKAILGRLNFTEYKLEQILEGTAIGFFQVDYQSNITYWNKAAEKIIGYKQAYIKGKNIWYVFAEVKGSDFYNAYEQAFKQREGTTLTEYFWPLQKWLSIDIYPVADGLIVNFTDVTHKKRTEDKLLEKVEQMKGVSLFNSHYIRKPVASLMGLTNLISEKIVKADEFKQVASYIHECALELDDIIKTVNTRVNYESFNDQAYEMEDLSLNVIINSIINDIQKQHPGRHLILKKKTEFKYYGNKKGITVAIKNLLNNAVRFSPGGSRIVIDLQIIAGNIVLSVKDFGIGIDGPLIKKLFLSLIEKENIHGMGYGLLQTAEIVQRHSGSVWIESEPGKGSVFSIRLPLSNIALFKSEGKTNFSNYKGPGVNVVYNEKEHYVIADWNGFHNLNSIKAGCVKILETLKHNKCQNFINDNTNIFGTWEDAVEWGANEWLPVVEATGLKYFAWVYSQSTFSRLSADITIKLYKGNMVHKTFNDKKNAVSWLKDKA